MSRRLIVIIALLVYFIPDSYSQKMCNLGGNLPPSEKVNFITSRSNQSILEIPVIFHVVGDDELIESIDSNSLYQIIEFCNEIFSATNENLIDVRKEFEPIIGSANIRFKIEQIIYQWSETKFIKSIFGSQNNLENAKISMEGGSDPIDTDRFLNIWVCNVLNSNGVVNNFNSSYATPPENAPGWPDFSLIQGVLIDDLVVLNRKYILPHELGHYLGLRHVVEISQGNCQDNDGIEDTPLCSRSPECIFRDSCPGGRVDMIENLMNPQVLDCRRAFTVGQTSYMRNILQEYRPLLYDEIAQPTHEIISKAVIYPNIVQEEFVIEFVDCNLKFVDICIYNNSGILMQKDRFVASKNRTVYINDFFPGMYYVTLEYQDQKDILKLVKI